MYSIQQRNRIYVKAYNRIAAKNETFICLAIKDAIHSWDVPTMRLLILFPEASAFKSRSVAGGGWYRVSLKGRNERLTALGFMIAMTDSK